MNHTKPIAAYSTATGTGWAATNKHGYTWPVDADIAATIESDRNARNENNGKPASPAPLAGMADQ